MATQIKAELFLGVCPFDLDSDRALDLNLISPRWLFARREPISRGANGADRELMAS